ncbi:putative ABC transporter, ATP-binding protein [Nocardia nova SH22a]|uniref:Putative ABC transporter, ATP-binding protein n=1 Tax=Nocardia nova SH22a TaxID=1415166 RepID=W5THH0_9NOCA|nr:ABC transporter ATP-binding protein [Nocardia nova]AHH18672.1 putative ABC transporter, ATP-binding protein [Nocardia nova SH22a]
MIPTDSFADVPAEPGPARKVGYRDLQRLLVTHRAEMLGGVLLLAAGTGLSMLNPLITMRIIDAVSAGSGIVGLVSLLCAAVVAQGAFEVAGTYVTAKAGERVVLGLRTRLIDHLLRLRMKVFDTQRVGDLGARLSVDTSLLRENAVGPVVQLVISTGAVVAAVSLMSWISFPLTLVSLVTTLLTAFIVTRALSGIRLAAERIQTSIGDLSSDAERALSSIRTVRASHATEREVQRLTGKAREAYGSGLSAARLEAVIQPTTLIVANGSFLIVLLAGGSLVASGSLSLSELVAFLLYSNLLVTPVSGAVALLGSLQRGMASFQRVDEAFSLEAEEDSVPISSRGPQVTAHADELAVPRRPASLRFDDVSFAYRPGQPILRGVSFTVEPGAQIALVGRSGSGKSTILSLIERFYRPVSGSIAFDGEDIWDLSLRQYRSGISYVEQDAPVMDGTVRDNLVYTVPGASEADITAAAVMSGFDEVIDRLGDGLDSVVGEHGKTLSGGERQRLAIARALLAKSRLLLLDEPTANLDPISEKAIAETLRNLRGSCTVIIVAHRFSTVRNADSIVVMNGGRVEAAGAHDTLVATNPYYQQFTRDSMVRSGA